MSEMHSLHWSRPERTAMLLAAVFVFLTVEPSRRGVSAPAHRGSRHAARDILEQKSASAQWERGRVRLRMALDRLAEPYGVPLFLDRRIDPDAPVSGNFPLQPLGGLFQAIGERHGFALTPIDGVAYLGPPGSARRLRTIDHLRRFEAQSLGPLPRENLLAVDSLSWENLATPRDLVEQVCRQARVSLANPELIPHDLWAAGSLPNMSRVTQLTILLAGFDLTFACMDPGVLTLRPVRDDELWDQAYPIPRAGAEFVGLLREQFPDVQVKVEPRRIHVTGFVEDHEAIRRWLQGGRPEVAGNPGSRAAAPPERRFALRVVRKPLRDVLRAVEKETDLRIAFDEAGKESAEAFLNQLVSFEVRGVDIDGLMAAILEPLGLRHRREGATVEILVPGRP